MAARIRPHVDYAEVARMSTSCWIGNRATGLAALWQQRDGEPEMMVPAFHWHQASTGEHLMHEPMVLIEIEGRIQQRSSRMYSRAAPKEHGSSSLRSSMPLASYALKALVSWSHCATHIGPAD
jgi:hypothetical protein